MCDFCNLTADEVFLVINLEMSVTMEPKPRLVDHDTKLTVTQNVCFEREHMCVHVLAT